MIAIGCDHAGFDYKQELMAHLKQEGIAFKDYGTFGKQSVDYPEFGLLVAKAVASGECDKGIVICGTGIGISIAANKVKGIRAALCGDVFSAKATRAHNDANVLAMGARVIGAGLMLEITDAFLNTPFEGGRHQKRIDMITGIEKL